MGFGGVIASALAGGIQGFGQGEAAVGKDEMAQADKAREMQMVEQREMRLQTLRNQSASDVANIAGGYHVQGANIAADASRDVADTHAESAGDVEAERSDASRYGADQALRGHQIAAGATVQAAKMHTDALRTMNRNVQVGGDGSVSIITEDPDGNPVAKPVLTPDGQVYTNSKDISQKDQSRVKVLGALIKEDTDSLGKAFDPKQKASIQQRIDRNTQAIATILDIPVPSAPQGAAGPWDKFKKPGS